jgi:hypothetical protein
VAAWPSCEDGERLADPALHFGRDGLARSARVAIRTTHFDPPARRRCARSAARCPARFASRRLLGLWLRDDVGWSFALSTEAPDLQHAAAAIRGPVVPPVRAQ